MHTLISGRGRYVLIHADEESEGEGKKRIETFVVGKDVERGERSVWVVEGGKYKASFLLDGEDGEGLLISEVSSVHRIPQHFSFDLALSCLNPIIHSFMVFGKGACFPDKGVLVEWLYMELTMLDCHPGLRVRGP